MIGSVPFSYIVAYVARGIDIRVEGEGNVGGRNVFRLVGARFGIAAGTLDASKGLIACALATPLASSWIALWMAGFAAVLGHNFPIFLKGRGGKGVSPAMGFLLGRFPLPLLSGALLIGLLFLLERKLRFCIGIGMASIPLIFMPLFKVSIYDIVATLLLVSSLGVKRIIDEAYMKQVKQKSGWK